ncbi:GNAT family N-acetyltransferase [Kovacikia minuta CCNUW1]|uniref:GNAT family N-acetyltransferase n=1 Tax=Kovacikia minuta TaxID=2931930 RepID=UPI001CCE259B|nr:GNAT family N-acetyltransferase [Kovacikia minuta]UBF27868.1 GNAT family N-acetyltransferase [Kovacikia minuta CCNUW1]
MTQVPPAKDVQIVIRPVQYRDLEGVERLYAEDLEADNIRSSIDSDRPFKGFVLRPWNGWLKALSLLLKPFQHSSLTYLAEQANIIRGVIRVSPFNRTRSTWRVDRVAVNCNPLFLENSSASESVFASDRGDSEEERESSEANSKPQPASPKLCLSDVGSLLLRYCFDTIWEARTWLLEVNVSDKDSLALYRENGFQPLAQITYWAVAPDQLQDLAEREPALPNLLPVSNADAQLLYQLDTASMPPLVRQVFDRHILDFKTSLIGSLIEGLKHWLNHTEMVSGYVFESQRKAAIGYFQIQLCRDGSQPHQAELTVHPAYTWLYSELTAQMARIVQDLPVQSLQLASSDYQPEREEYLERLGATRISHTLMMSRSVWHKVKESKPNALEGLQFPEVLQGLKPARKPVPSRISALKLTTQLPQTEPQIDTASDSQATGTASDPASRNGKSSSQSTKRIFNLQVPSDFSDPPQEGPCC